MTKAQAQSLGRRTRDKMRGKGWKVHVWDNIGWHIKIYKGSIAIYVNDGIRRTYMPAFDRYCGDRIPSGTRVEFSVDETSFTDPNDAVQAQMHKAVTVAAKYARIQAKTLQDFREYCV